MFFLMGPEAGARKTLAEKARDAWDAFQTDAVDGARLLVEALVVIAVALVAFQILRRLFGRNELVFDKLVNASGESDLEPFLPGLTQEAREQLMKEIQEVRDRALESHQAFGVGDKSIRGAPPFPASASDQRAQDIVDSLKELAPRTASPFVRLLGREMLVSGIRITGTLQRLTAENKVGVTFEVADLGGHGARLATFWEASGAGSPGDRWRAVLGSTALRWLAVELLRHGMRRDLRQWRLRRDRRADEARICCFVGAIYLACAQVGVEHFYDLSQRDLEEACKLAPSWYRPRYLLALALSCKGQLLDGRPGEPLRDNDASLQEKALGHYKKAVALARRENTEPGASHELVLRKIEAGWARALVLAGRPDEAREMLARAMDSAADAARLRDEKRAEAAVVLYNVAGGYALAAARASNDEGARTGDMEQMRRALAMSLAADPSDLDYPLVDPDFKEKVTHASVVGVLAAIRAEQNKPGAQALERRSGKAFDRTVENILDGDSRREG